MGRTKIASLLVIGALSIVAVLGVLTYRTVYAQTPTPGATDQPDANSRPSGDFHRGKPGGFTDEDLAAALGIDTQELQAAYQTATEEALEQAVSAGLITQEQADALLANGRLGRRFRGLGMLSENGIDYNALLANALGISEEELDDAYQEALSASLDRAVAEGALTQEQADLMKASQALYADENFQSNMQSAFEAAVQQAVTDGVITQAQADQILASRAGMNFMGRGGFGDFGGHGFGRHGRGGGGAPFVPESQAPTEDAPTNDA